MGVSGRAPGEGARLPTTQPSCTPGRRTKRGIDLDNCVSGVSVQPGGAQRIPDGTGRQALTTRQHFVGIANTGPERLVSFRMKRNQKCVLVKLNFFI